MFKLICCTFLFAQVAIHASVVKRETVREHGNHILVCKQEPIELGIVLDSSSSISHQDFQKGIEFLQNFLDQYEIGDGRNDVRVSIITFGKGIYPQDAFNLTTYDSKEEVIDAIGRVPHRAGLYTSTGLAIDYMRDAQLSPLVCRPWAERICIVITDGNSQRWRDTKKAAEEAREQGIIMFVVGVGNVRQKELLNIAGEEDRIVKVTNYDQLKDIKKSLARQTCIKKERPTTTPAPLAMTQTCGQTNPSDIYFAFSPSDLGSGITAWTTSFISTTVKQEALEDGFRFGVVSGSCPDDAGFDLDDYTTSDAIDMRLTEYLKPRMSTLVKQLTGSAYSEAEGGRSYAQNVAVLVAKGGKKTKGLQKEVDALTEAGVQVFIADPTNSGISLNGATTLTGRSAKDVSANLVSYLCPSRT